jgi:hypothetical protein
MARPISDVASVVNEISTFVRGPAQRMEIGEVEGISSPVRKGRLLNGPKRLLNDCPLSSLDGCGEGPQ